jgi:hypothetical protein
MTPLIYVSCLGAVVVGAPGDDGLLDGFAVEVLIESFEGEGADLLVGGEAQSDELIGGESGDLFMLRGRKDGGEAKAFFEPYDAVLNFKSSSATGPGHE